MAAGAFFSPFLAGGVDLGHLSCTFFPGFVQLLFALFSALFCLIFNLF